MAVTPDVFAALRVLRSAGLPEQLVSPKRPLRPLCIGAPDAGRMTSATLDTSWVRRRGHRRQRGGRHERLDRECGWSCTLDLGALVSMQCCRPGTRPI